MNMTDKVLGNILKGSKRPTLRYDPRSKNMTQQDGEEIVDEFTGKQNYHSPTKDKYVSKGGNPKNGKQLFMQKYSGKQVFPPREGTVNPEGSFTMVFRPYDKKAEETLEKQAANRQFLDSRSQGKIGERTWVVTGMTSVPKRKLAAVRKGKSTTASHLGDRSY